MYGCIVYVGLASILCLRRHFLKIVGRSGSKGTYRRRETFGPAFRRDQPAGQCLPDPHRARLLHECIGEELVESGWREGVEGGVRCGFGEWFREVQQRGERDAACGLSKAKGRRRNAGVRDRETVAPVEQRGVACVLIGFAARKIAEPRVGSRGGVLAPMEECDVEWLDS
jgi:hypothetical protein